MNESQNNPNKKSLKKYTRPKITYTDTLQSAEKIKKSLENYDRVNDIDELPLGTFIKYITFTNNKPRLCIGGILYKKCNDYVMIKGRNHIIFSVQKHHWGKGADKTHDDPVFITIFWKNKVDKKKIQIEQLKKQVKTLQYKNHLLMQQLSQIYKDHPEMFT